MIDIATERNIKLHRLELMERMLKRKLQEVHIAQRNIEKAIALDKLKEVCGLKKDDQLLALDDMGWCYAIGTLMKIVGAGIYSDGLSVDVKAVDGNTIIACVPLEKILMMRKAWDDKHGDING